MILCKLRLLLTKDFVHSRDESLRIHNVKNWLPFIAITEKGTVFRDNRKMFHFNVGTRCVIPTIAIVTSDGVIVIMGNFFWHLWHLLSEFELSPDFFVRHGCNKGGKSTRPSLID